MGTRNVAIEEFLVNTAEMPIADVRSPSEFARASIPDSSNLPLFDDRERSTVGKIYKEKGRNAAIDKGLDIAGRKLTSYVATAKRIAPEKKIQLYCWRGGMRSASIGWLLDVAGFRTHILEGGYKSYRHWALDLFRKKLRLIVVGGLTGSRKTALLKTLGQKGEQVIDLEALAHHKGSAFGGIHGEAQNSNEQFENDCARDIYRFDPEKPVWIEDESRNIGKNLIPAGLFRQMTDSPLIQVTVPDEQRIRHLVREYACYDDERLKACLEKISRRLGGTRFRQSLQALSKHDYSTVVKIVLEYYDKTYRYGLDKRDPGSMKIFRTDLSDLSGSADKLIQFAKISYIWG